MKKERIGLWILSSVLVGLASVLIAYAALIALGHNIEWPGAIALALVFPFVSGATLFFYCVGCLVVFSAANEKAENNSLGTPFFLYVSKMNFLAFLISLGVAIVLQVAFLL